MKLQDFFKPRLSQLRIKVSAPVAAKTAFIIGLFSPLIAFLGLATAFWAALYNEDRSTPQTIMTPILLLGFTIPIVFCITGIAFGITGIKSEQRNTAISGIIFSGLTLFFFYGLRFFY